MVNGRRRVGSVTQGRISRRTISSAAKQKRFTRRVGVGRRKIKPTPVVQQVVRQPTKSELEVQRQEIIDTELAKIDTQLRDSVKELNQIESAQRSRGFSQGDEDSRRNFLGEFIDRLRQGRLQVEAGRTNAAEAQKFAEASGVSRNVRAFVKEESGSDIVARFEKGEITEAQFEKAFAERTGELPLITGRQTISPTVITGTSIKTLRERALGGDVKAQQALEAAGINFRTGVPFGTLEAIEDQNILDVDVGFTSSNFFPSFGITPKINFGEIGRRASRKSDVLPEEPKFALFDLALGAISSVAGTAQFVETFSEEPIETTTSLAGGIKELVTSSTAREKALSDVGSVIFNKPVFALGFFGAEIATDIAAGKAVGALEDVSDVGAARLSGKFTPLQTVDDIDIIRVPTTVTTKTRKLGVVEGIADTSKILGTVDDTKTIEILRSGQGFDLPPAEAIKLAGTKIDAVSASVGAFDSFTDELVVGVGKKTPKPLDTSFFFDPQSRLRTSRLGLEQGTASITDILTGDVTFARTKPQAITLFDTQVEAFPKSLQPVVSKIKRGQPLSSLEQRKLLEFQLTPSGKVKPLGFVSSEAEVSLAPGEILRKTGTLGVTEIDGRKVTIISTEIGQASPELKTLQLKSALGDISSGERLRLQTLQIAESGISRNLDVSPILRVLPTPSISRDIELQSQISITPSRSQTLSSVSRASSTSSSLSILSPISSISSISPLSPISPTSPVSPTSPISPSGASSLGRITPGGKIAPKPFLKSFKTPSQPKQPQQSFGVQVRKGGVFKTVGRRSTARGAFQLGAGIVGRTLAATFKIDAPRGIGALGLGARDPTIKRKKRERLTFVEIPSARLDTPSEVSLIQTAKRRKKKKK